MSSAPAALDEERRLAALHDLGLLDTPAEERFDRLVELASIMVGVPIALISLVDRDRQWFKAKVGIDVDETERQIAFCSHAIADTGPGPFVVNDARQDHRFAENPLVTGDPNIRFYAGQVLHDRNGLAMGTICAIDRVPRELTEPDQRALELLGQLVEQEFHREDQLQLIADLAESEREKSRILDTLTEGLVLQDPDGRIVQWNPAAERVLGLSAGELGGRTSMDPRWQATQADGTPLSGESHPAMVALRTQQPVYGALMGVHRPDGSRVWLRVNAEPIIEADGTTAGVLAAFSDVTAEIEARRQTESLRDRLHAAIERSGIGTALVDASWRATYVNEAFAAILGVAPEQLVEGSLTELIHPDDRHLDQDDLDALASGCVLSITHEVRLVGADADGRTRWVRIHRSRLTNEAPDDAAYLVQLEDVTPHHALEDALRRSEEAARVSLDALEQGVILLGADGSVQRINPAASRLLGYAGEDLEAQWRNPNLLTFAENGEPMSFEERPLYRAFFGHEDIVGETVGWERSDGTRILVRLSCIRDAAGSGGLVVAFTDVTAEHRARRLLDATLDTAPVGLAIIGDGGAIVRCNTVFARHTGRTSDELVGTPMIDLIAPDDLPPAAAMRRLRAGVMPDGDLIQRVVHPDGGEVWLNARLAMIPDPDESLAIAATFDVTQQRRMTQELSRFRYLFEHANDIVTVIDAHGQVQYASPSGTRVLGYPDRYDHPQGILGLVHPDDIPSAGREMDALIAGTRGAEPFTLRVRAHDGAWHHLECVGVNLLDEPAVHGIVITARDATERQLLSEQLAHRASHDTLTDLPNRSVLDDLLTDALSAAARDHHHVGLCFVDLDGFKAVNDTLGHGAGDQLLVDVADRIRSMIRPIDTAARIGGDEFVIVIDSVGGAAEALAIAHRVRDALIAPGLMLPEGVTFGASFGVTLSEPDDTPATLLRRADAALYRAKSKHNSSIEFASLSSA